MEKYKIGRMEYWNIGNLEEYNIKYRQIGIMEYWRNAWEFSFFNIIVEYYKGK